MVFETVANEMGNYNISHDSVTKFDQEFDVPENKSFNALKFYLFL